MIYKKAVTLFGTAIFIRTAFMSATVSGQVGGDKSKLTLNELAGNSLGGAWKLNGTESDNALEKARVLFLPKESPEKPAAEQSEIPALSVSLFPPESLVLAGGESEITINENFKDLVLTRTIATDGRINVYKLNSGENYSVAAIRKTIF